jgi:hypothetical protein
MAARHFVGENIAERQRLHALVARLTDVDMGRPLGDGWTVAAGLCHLAFWDRLCWLGKFDEWDRAGAVALSRLPDADRINDAMLPWWLAVSYDQTRHEVVAADEAIDSRVETVADAVVEQILALRPRTIVRAVHRREHLDQIERLLGA